MNQWCFVQAQQEELSQYRQRCQDTEARHAALASAQQEAEKSAIIQLEELTRLQKQHAAAEAKAALRIAQLEQAASDAGASAQVHCCDAARPSPLYVHPVSYCKLRKQHAMRRLHAKCVARMASVSAP